MKKTGLFTLLFSLFVCNIAISQVLDPETLSEANGTMLNTKEYIDVQGSPYLIDQWMRADVKLFGNADIYKNMQIKYDLVKDRLIFKPNNNEESFLFVSQVERFVIFEEGTNKVRIFLYLLDDNKKKTKSFFEELTTGKSTLLKRITKKILQRSEFSSATKTSFFEENVSYFVKTDQGLIALKLEKKSIFNVLGDKTDFLESYIKSNNLNLKREEDTIKLFKYYNSL